MNLSKKTSYTLAIGAVLLATSGYLAIKKYSVHRNWRDEIESSPWDVPKKYTSWETLFGDQRYSRSMIVKLQTNN